MTFPTRGCSRVRSPSSLNIRESGSSLRKRVEEVLGHRSLSKSTAVTHPVGYRELSIVGNSIAPNLARLMLEPNVCWLGVPSSLLCHGFCTSPASALSESDRIRSRFLAGESRWHKGQMPATPFHSLAGRVMVPRRVTATGDQFPRKIAQRPQDAAQVDWPSMAT